MHARPTTDRRCFLQIAAAAAASWPLAAGGLAAEPAEKVVPTEKRMKKAVKFGMVKYDGSVLDKFKLLKELGFDGVELDAPSALDKNEVLEARDATGLEIPGVVDSAHWRDTLSDADSGIRAKGVEALEERCATPNSTVPPACYWCPRW